MIGFLITVVVVILVVGILLWAINAFPWIDADFKQAAKIVIVVVVALWLILTLIGYVPAVNFPYRR